MCKMVDAVYVLVVSVYLASVLYGFSKSEHVLLFVFVKTYNCYVCEKFLKMKMHPTRSKENM